jgi:perosamine synthetase
VIPLHKISIPHDLDALMEELRSLMLSGWVGEGPKVAAFEEALKPVVGSENVTALNSCTSALQLALRLAGVGPGDEVITTPMTCMATNLPILLAGAKPVWADINPQTGNISHASIRERISDRTKAIVIVHWGGYPCDIQEINSLARTIGAKVIEDAAHALGASYRGKPIGSHSDFTCFSFQAIKHIHTGDGGLLVCRSMVDHARARSLKWFGIDREKRQINEYGIAEWEVTEPGYKMHMNDLAATIGLSQLPQLKTIIDARTLNSRLFDESFGNLSRVKPIERSLQHISSDWLYTLLVDDQLSFIRQLRERGITASIVHSRNDRSPVFAKFRQDLPGVDSFSKRMVCIPVGPWVGASERSQIIEAVRSESW